MLCYKGISYSLSRLLFRFATSAVSVDAFKYYVQNKQIFCIFLTFSPKKYSYLCTQENKAYERHSCKSVVIPL